MGARAVGDVGGFGLLVMSNRTVILSAKPLSSYILSSITQLNLPSQGLKLMVNKNCRFSIMTLKKLLIIFLILSLKRIKKNVLHPQVFASQNQNH